MLPEANRKVPEYLVTKLTQSHTTILINGTDIAIFAIAMFLTILMLIWMVALMYRAYAVSCNIKGPKAIVTFIIGLIGAEMISKVIILALARTL
jgi:predicted nuclease of restriction endonuclease-like RecB superfamily